jgi:mannose-6-phosphate isomerase-like protein (cupin superfamily)
MSDQSIMEFRRIVSGYGAAGASTVVIDEHVTPQLSVTPDYHLCDLWEARLTDPDPAGAMHTIERDYRLSDHPGEMILKKVIWPPQAKLDAYYAEHGNLTTEVATQLSLPETPTPIPNVLMHETKTIDFITIISGEISCIFEDGEVTLRPGDTLIQREVNHGWVNRSSEPCVMTCVMISSMPLRDAGQ